ncbi:hypothetical protein [Dendronalium sp. ChiSLP03b]|uniref:hypothetical protein n=1 Tax=Dendronalium sp. ChiSLP03b TaxID=3075381 RepID=UPI00391A0F00
MTERVFTALFADFCWPDPDTVLNNDIELAPDYLTHTLTFSQEHLEIAAFSKFLFLNGNV